MLFSSWSHGLMMFIVCIDAGWMEGTKELEIMDTATLHYWAFAFRAIEASEIRLENFVCLFPIALRYLGAI
jgi:hypothetical protein